MSIWDLDDTHPSRSGTSFVSGSSPEHFNALLAHIHQAETSSLATTVLQVFPEIFAKGFNNNSAQLIILSYFTALVNLVQ